MLPPRRARAWRALGGGADAEARTPLRHVGCKFHRASDSCIDTHDVCIRMPRNALPACQVATSSENIHRQKDTHTARFNERRRMDHTVVLRNNDNTHYARLIA